MEKLRECLGELYEQFGLNEVIVAMSQYLDKLVLEEQKKKVEDKE